MRRMIFNGSLVLTAVAVVALCSLSWAQMTKADEDQRLGMESHIGKLTGHAAAAKGNYRRYCVGCHGELGDGEGENAQWIDPKPRNFTLGIFKCRSTTTGTLAPGLRSLQHHRARSEQLEYAVLEPAFGATAGGSGGLCKALLGALGQGKAREPRSRFLPSRRSQPNESKAGQAVFQRVECWKCHGPTGSGNGPSAATLTDDQNRPIQPYNFHDSNRFKCGTSDEDLYKIFMTGLDGTPMPSWSDNIKPDEAWDLVFYLRSLQPMKSKEKEIARQIGLKPGAPSAAPAPAPQP